MKLNRLLEITTILLNKRKAKACDLAERFGVSVRTIYRDIDIISSSGIPVYTVQGKSGGIYLMEDYSMDRTILSEKERNNIILALKTLEATKYPEMDMVIEKLGGLFKNNSDNWISVDFSPWGSSPNFDKRFDIVKIAILEKKIIRIEYINSLNERSNRKIKPIHLNYKSRAWYLWGWCLKSKDYRTFRLSRIKKAEITDDIFDDIENDINNKEEILSKNNAHNKEKPVINLVIQFAQEALYRVYDDYDDDIITDNKDGTYLVRMTVEEDEWVYGYILSFGTYAKVIEPEHVKAVIRERAKGVYNIYES